MLKNFNYTTTGISINIPCQNPAATHAMLLQSIVSNVGYSAGAEYKTDKYADEIMPLIQLLKTLLPTEQDLEKMQE